MKKYTCGNEMDRMPNWAFRIMAFMFNFSDKIKSPDKRLDSFSIQKGQVVIDYGCGTGRYLKPASDQVGETGKVFAVDIHELAIESTQKIIKRYNLKNVFPVLTDGKSVNIPDQMADVIFALDMFHMVKDSEGFLKELHRITKHEGILYLEDGHQPRKQTKQKVLDSGYWIILEETGKHLKCKPN